MKKFVIFIAVIGSIYFIKPDLFSTLFSDGAFDVNGQPVVWLFTAKNCGSYCNDVIALLGKRKIDYQEFDVNTENGKKHLNLVGANTNIPLTVLGSNRVLGNKKFDIVSMLAEEYGDEVLTRSESRVMDSHFYEGGEPMVVMYGTSWCGYCKKMRSYFAENDIDYTEFDAEGSGKQAYNILEGGGYPLMYVGYRRVDGADIDQLERYMVEIDY